MRRMLLLIPLGSLLLASPAGAAPFVIEFQYEITGGTADPFYGIGSTLTGGTLTLHIETWATPSDPYHCLYGNYLWVYCDPDVHARFTGTQGVFEASTRQNQYLYQLAGGGMSLQGGQYSGWYEPRFHGRITPGGYFSRGKMAMRISVTYTTTSGWTFRDRAYPQIRFTGQEILVPEPTTASSLGFGVLGLGGYAALRRLRRARSSPPGRSEPPS